MSIGGHSSAPVGLLIRHDLRRPERFAIQPRPHDLSAARNTGSWRGDVVKEECWVLTEGTEEEEDGGGLNGLSGAIIEACAASDPFNPTLRPLWPLCPL